MYFRRSFTLGNKCGKSYIKGIQYYYSLKFHTDPIHVQYSPPVPLVHETKILLYCLFQNLIHPINNENVNVRFN